MPGFAGDVRRYHTWPCIQTQTNAAHTWHVMRIYFQLFGPLPPKVTTYLIWHDAGEIRTGDLPFPVKSSNPVLKAETVRLETDALLGMGVALPKLSVGAALRCKICDLLEMYDFGLVEVSLGNKMMKPIVDDTRVAALNLARQLPIQSQVTRVSDFVINLSRRFQCA